MKPRYRPLELFLVDRGHAISYTFDLSKLSVFKIILACSQLVVAFPKYKQYDKNNKHTTIIEESKNRSSKRNSKRSSKRQSRKERMSKGKKTAKINDLPETTPSGLVDIADNYLVHEERCSNKDNEQDLVTTK